MYQDAKIIHYLNAMTKIERRRFWYYAQGFIKKAPEINILEHLIACVEKGQSVDSPKVEKWLSALSSESVKKTRIRLFSRYVDCAKDFLAGEQLCKKEFKTLRQALLTSRLRPLGARALFAENANSVQRFINDFLELDGENYPSNLFFYPIMMWLIDEIYFSPFVENKASFNEEKSNETYFHLLDIFYSMAILRHALQTMAKKRLGKSSFDLNRLNEVLAMVEKAPWGKFPLLNIYRLGIELFKNFTPDTYLSLKKLVLETFKNIPDKEKNFIFKILINHTAQAMRTDEGYTQDSFEVYDFGLKNGLLEVDGIVLKGHFINYITLACNLKKIAEAKEFMLQMKGKLQAEWKAQVLLICESRIALTERHYKKAFVLLKDENFRSDQFRLTARTNRVMACYEWYTNGEEAMELDGEDVLIVDELKLYERSLNRLKKHLAPDNTIIPSNLCFLKWLRRLVEAAKTIVTKVDKEQLKRECKMDQVICRAWLLEKINEL